MKGLRLQRAVFMLYVLSIVGTVAPQFLFDAALHDLQVVSSSGGRVISSTEVPIGIETDTSFFRPVPTGDLILEFEFRIPRTELRFAGGDRLATPFRLSYRFMTHGQQMVYSGSDGPLYVSLAEDEPLHGSKETVTVVHRERIYRAGDMGPVRVRTAITGSARNTSSVNLRVYDEIEQKSSGGLRLGIISAIICPQLVLLFIGVLVYQTVQLRRLRT